MTDMNLMEEILMAMLVRIKMTGVNVMFKCFDDACLDISQTVSTDI